jgi:murein DD-endopeptidase MepM/ murein hydrolase activator NlpD
LLGNPVEQAFIRPLGSPPIAGSFRVTRDCAGHEATKQGCALDLGDERSGAPVVAALAGKVVHIDVLQGIVALLHANGWRTEYAHMSPIRVKLGDVVGQGAWLGDLDSAHDPVITNFAGAHLHFAVRLSATGPEVDPWPLLAQNEEESMPAFKAVSPAIGVFVMPPGQHALISPSDPKIRYPQPAGGAFNVYASLDLAADIDGHIPPQHGREQVYLVDAPNFGAAAYALRQDGTFTPVDTAKAAAHNAANDVAAASANAAAKYST